MIVSLLYRIRNLFIGVAVVANVAGALFILALVLMLSVDVIARGVFNAPFRGIIELVIFSLVLIVFLQLPDVVRSGRLTRSDGLMLMLPARYSDFLSRAIDLLAAIFMAVAAYTVWPEVVRAFESCRFFTAPLRGSGGFWADLQASFRRCDYFGTPGILRAPWWPAKLAIFFGLSLSAILFLFRVILPERKLSEETLVSSK
ncbi:TRAP transporter small permease [Alkalilacustris brevis]|uniref:TRAP transporter small permease n=1 Tax=Alkalilacustris brevis TaxID=2026338 RepID=UPI000E0D9106|nr:TRAP transporter small permease subunit [Alkalilacustris brevis]